MAFKMAPKSPTLKATGKFASAAKQKAAGDLLNKQKEKSTAGNFEPAGEQRAAATWKQQMYPFGKDGLGRADYNSGVKGKMGSKLRKAEYDARGWAYDETISKASLKKPKKKVKKAENHKSKMVGVKTTKPSTQLAATKPVGGKPKKSKVNRADGIQVKEVPKVVGEELGKATKFVGKHLGKAAKWLGGKSKEIGNTTIVKPKGKKKQVATKSIKERLGKKTDFSTPSKKKVQPKAAAKQTAKQKKNLPKKVVAAIAAKKMGKK